MPQLPRHRTQRNSTVWVPTMAAMPSSVTGKVTRSYRVYSSGSGGASRLESTSGLTAAANSLGTWKISSARLSGRVVGLHDELARRRACRVLTSRRSTSGSRYELGLPVANGTSTYRDSVNATHTQGLYPGIGTAGSLDVLARRQRHDGLARRRASTRRPARLSSSSTFRPPPRSRAPQPPVRSGGGASGLHPTSVRSAGTAARYPDRATTHCWW